MTEELGTFVVIYEDDGDVLTVIPRNWDSIEANFAKFHSTGVDTPLHLTTVAGEECVILASSISKFNRSTPEGRFNALRLEKLRKDERKAHMHEAGYEWDEVEATE